MNDALKHFADLPWVEIVGKRVSNRSGQSRGRRSGHGYDPTVVD
ncbi:hypothetical protein [Novipirellula sp.]